MWQLQIWISLKWRVSKNCRNKSLMWHRRRESGGVRRRPYASASLGIKGVQSAGGCSPAGAVLVLTPAGFEPIWLRVARWEIFTCVIYVTNIHLSGCPSSPSSWRRSRSSYPKGKPKRCKGPKVSYQHLPLQRSGWRGAPCPWGPPWTPWGAPWMNVDSDIHLAR